MATVPYQLPVALTSAHELSVGNVLRAGIVTGWGNGTWPTANKALYIPFVLPVAGVVQQIAVVVANQIGNLDAGIYDAGGGLIVSAGSTAVGAAGPQFVDIADTALGPGAYYMALAMSSATASIQRAAPSLSLVRAAGVLMQTSALALPSTATFAQAADAYLPLVSLVMGRMQ